MTGSSTYYGGTIARTDPAFLNDFSDAIVQDLRYLQSHGLRVSMRGLQNEPFIRPPKPKTVSPDDTKQAFATFPCMPVDYYKVMQAAVPKVRALLLNVHIHAPSCDGPAGEYAAELRKDLVFMKDIDAWTWHQIGHNSNDQIDLQAKYLQGADGEPVCRNEFEYQPWGDMKVFGERCARAG